MRELQRKIKSKNAVIGIIGLGYVGLPLAIAFCKAGFRVIGFDVDKGKVSDLQKGKSYLKHIPSDEIKTLRKRDAFTTTSSFSALKNVDCIAICVPTPLSKHKEPDLSHIIDATKIISKHLAKSQLVILTSTTYPGTTEEVVLPLIESEGRRKVGRDIFLAYSPEREDPNNKEFTLRTIPRVVSGCTQSCLRLTQTLFSTISERVVSVSSTKTAEAEKLLENIYRAVNIALVNELKILFDKMDVNIWEVIEAAKTKPFGFQAFYPGPGLGGHCIPIDPYYLTWKAKAFDFHTRFIELAGEINTMMPYYVVSKVADGLNRHKKSIANSKILILGLSYKKDIDDMRESPSLKLMEILEQKGAQVDFNDPYIGTLNPESGIREKKSVRISRSSIGKYDCVLIATDHSCYDYIFIANNAQLVIDTRNATSNILKKNIVKS